MLGNTVSHMEFQAGTANNWNGGPQKGAGNWRAFGGRTGVHRQYNQGHHNHESPH